MSRGVIVLWGFVLLFIGFVVWYRWDSKTNHGYKWGYWSQFNTVSNALASLPGVTILKSGANADMTMEEFGFEVLNSDGRQLHVWFSEADPVRRLSGRALTNALLYKLKKLAASKPSAG